MKFLARHPRIVLTVITVVAIASVMGRPDRL